MNFRPALALIFLVLVPFSTSGQGIVAPKRIRTADNRASLPEKAKAASGSEAATTSNDSGLPGALPVSGIKIKVAVDGQLAIVRVEHTFRNDTDDALEGTYYFPVPEGATLLEFAVFDGDQRRRGHVKEKEEAREVYAQARSQGEDPTILEMTRRGWFQSHVYPIPPHADKKIEIVYSEVLPSKEGVVSFDYPLGRGYKKLRVPVGTVEIQIDVTARTPITNFFSPTHPLAIEFDGDRRVTANLRTDGGGDAENFHLTYSLADEEVSASLITFRKEGNDGYFLLILSPKVDLDPARVSSKDVVFVVDVSDSMSGDKLAQARRHSGLA